MSLTKTFAIMLKEIRHILRDRTTFLMLLFIPVFLMIIFAYSLAVDVKEVRVAVLNRDRSTLTRDYLATLSNSRDLIIDWEAKSYAEAEAWFDRSLIKALVVIPANFSEKLSAGRPVEVQMLVDGTDPTSAQFAITHLVSRSEAFGYNVAAQVFNRLGNDPVSVKTPLELRVRTWYNPTLNNQIGIVPALLALVLNLPAVAVMSAIVREKELGTLEQLFATPLGRAELLVGKIVPYIVCGLISAVFCATAAVTLFDAPFNGSLALFILFSADFFMAAFSVGLLISIFLSSQAAASVVGLLVFLFPGFFLSGIFYPVSAFPELVQQEAAFIPSTPFVAIIRGLMVKGQGLMILWPQAVLLFGIALSTTVISVLLFKKRLR